MDISEKQFAEEYDQKFMVLALKEAKKAYAKGETPVGAVIVCGGEVVAKAHNTREMKKNALHHAEIKAIDKACHRLGGWRLHKCDIYVTLEPCPMCAGAIINSRIKRVFYGAGDPKAGSFGSVVDLCALPYNHIPLVYGGFMKDECASLLKEFFALLRAKR